MDVEHRLTRSGVAVENSPVAAFLVPVFLGDRSCSTCHLTDQPIILSRQFVERWDVTSRHDEHVHRRLRIDVPECDEPVVLVDEVARDLAGNNSAEEAI